MYGSNFWMVTESPLACNSFAKDAETMPLPKEEVTPPVTKMYFAVATNLKLKFGCKGSLLYLKV